MNWCFWTVVLEKTLESPLDCKEIEPVNPKGNQCWIFTGRTDAEAEALILWPPDVKNWLSGKDLDAGKDWRQEEKGMTEDEMVGWYHRLSGHEFEQTLGVGDGQGGLAWCSPWGRRVGHDLGTEQQQKWCWTYFCMLTCHPHFLWWSDRSSLWGFFLLIEFWGLFVNIQLLINISLNSVGPLVCAFFK